MRHEQLPAPLPRFRCKRRLPVKRAVQRIKDQREIRALIVLVARDAESPARQRLATRRAIDRCLNGR